jgi:hypothetical protein
MQDVNEFLYVSRIGKPTKVPRVPPIRNSRASLEASGRPHNVLDRESR